MSSRVTVYFIDANIPMYIAGRPHRYKAPSTSFMLKVARGDIEGLTDSEVLQEILYRYFYINKLDVGLKVFDNFVKSIPLVLAVTKDDALRARELLEKYREIRPRDAIHAAVMLNNGVGTIVSYDRHFDLIKEIKRIEPEG